MNEIKDLEKLLLPKLGTDKKITNIEISKISAKGVGSLMLKVKVQVTNANGKEEVLHLVAKKIPESQGARKAFNILETFKTEVEFYRTIVPLLKEFEKEENVKDRLDCFPEFYGARYNLDGCSDEVDEHGVFLLEDLDFRGFQNFNRETGVDLRAAESILHDLAKFHATVIALKFKKPDVLEEKIKPLCNTFDFIKNRTVTGALNTLKELIKTFPNYAHVADKATNVIEKPAPKPREPFGTLSHYDLWTNNVMNKIEKDGTVKNIFVDFQLYNYRSITTDIFFFLWTSIEKEILEKHIDHLLRNYHNQLLKTLTGYGVYTGRFEYKNFEKDLKAEADYEFGHALFFVFMLKFVKKLETQDMSKLKIEVADIRPELKDFIYFMVSECVKRGWL